ncbi:MAG: restriction endonuclease subunit S [Brevibacterium sp.]|uniref:restriction endonuclease subunit S n=1 Tax=Brevibacterium sp. TaxID=1701 RepID=UPI003F9387FD
MSRIDELIQELCPDGVPTMSLGELLDYEQPGRYLVASTDYRDEYATPVLTAGQTFILGYTDEVKGVYSANQESPVLIFDDFTTAFKWVDFPFKAKSSAMKMLTLRAGAPALIRYIYFAMQCIGFEPQDHARHWIGKYSLFRIPVPPLEVQREIVRVLDKFTQLEAELEAELEARRTQYEHYRAECLTFKEEVPRRRLDEVAVYANGKAHEKLVVDGAEIPLVTARFISRNGEANRYVPLADVLTPGRTGDVALVLSDLPNGRALARTFFVDRNDSYAINQRVARITVKETAEMNPKFLHFLLDRNRGLLKHDNGVDQTHLSKGQVTGLTIPVPSIEEQNRIVDRLERFDGLVNDISIGLPAELAARRKQYEHYRDRLLTFKELTV